MARFDQTFCMLLILTLLLSALAHAGDDNKRIVLTFDDLVFGGPDRGLDRIKETNEKLLETLKKYSVPAIGFVNESKLNRNNEYEQRRAILAAWLEAGMELGNHTYSHPDLNTTPLDEFISDFERGEKTVNELLAKRGERMHFFRHPFLHSGMTLEKKQNFEKYLSENGYSVAPVTFDNADYIYAVIYSDFKSKNDTATMQRMGKEYIAYMDKVAAFYEGASQHLFSRQIPHIFLLHANEINADYLDELLDMLKARGYEFISMAEALKDPAYGSEDKYVGRAGTSWLFRWDFTRGRTYDWRAEPPVDDWIMKAYNSRGSGY